MKLAGARVSLRPLDEADRDEIAEWWTEAATVVRGSKDAEEITFASALARQIHEERDDLLAIRRVGATEPIGVLSYRMPADDWLEFRFLALAAGQRGWGYGSEAVRLVEGATLCRNFLARVYVDNGLGLYFWLRMGYRPAVPDEAFWQKVESGDIITMIRIS